MPSRFFTPSKKWPDAVREALSYITDLQGYGEIDEPAFLFGPPSDGRLPFRIRTRGHTRLLCELGDEYPFLDELRGWMERCLLFDRFGEFHPEFATLDNPGGVSYLLMVHAGWERGPVSGVTAISELIAIRSDDAVPVFRCFCRTRDTVKDLYGALRQSIREYAAEFDDPARWYDPKMFSALDRKPTSLRMEERLRSAAIETKTGYSEKRAH